MNIKKFKSITILIFSFVFLLVACSDSDNADNSNEEKPYEGETLSLIMDKDDSTQDLQDNWIPQFEEETGIDVDVEILPESGYDTKLNLAISSGQEDYDVVRTGVKNWNQLVDSDWLEPLDEYLEESSEDYTDGFEDKLLDTLAVDGTNYSIPYSVGADLLFYNKEMFEEAGLDPEDPPNDMEELVEYAEKLHKPDNNQAGFVSRGTKEGNENYTDIRNQPEAVETLEQYKKLMGDYGPKGASSVGFDEAQLAMQQEEAAMWLGAAQLGPALEDEEESNIAGDVGYKVLEGKENTGEDYVSGAVWGFSMVKSAENKDAAWELIKFLTSKEVVKEQTISGDLGSPGRSDIFDDEEVKEVLNEDFADALQEANEHTNPIYSPIISEGDEIRGAMSSAISEVLSGDEEPKEALDKANEEIKDILE